MINNNIDLAANISVMETSLDDLTNLANEVEIKVSEHCKQGLSLL